MLPTPRKVRLAAGGAEGEAKLTAFDKALLAAGIGNINLIRVSSILPPDCTFEEHFPVPPGSLTPTAYGTMTSDKPGEQIAAAIGIGFSHDDYGVIMEFASHCGKEEAEERVAAMVREAFVARNKELKELKVLGVSRVVEKTAAVVAAAVLWY